MPTTVLSKTDLGLKFIMCDVDSGGGNYGVTSGGNCHHEDNGDGGGEMTRLRFLLYPLFNLYYFCNGKRNHEVAEYVEYILVSEAKTNIDS